MVSRVDNRLALVDWRRDEEEEWNSDWDDDDDDNAGGHMVDEIEYV